MKLSELISPIRERIESDRPPDTGTADPDIHSIHYRSRDVAPGGLFAAIPGFKADGHDYIGDAVSRGAVAVLAQKPCHAGVPVIRVADTRACLGPLAARFHGDPSAGMKLIAITGTNGKTTTAAIVESILAANGHSVGVIGTIDYHFDGRHFAASATTPESLDLQRMLHEMRQAGVTHVVLEASSHAIALNRLNHCWLDAGVFTNLSQDHLDFHERMESYWECKQRLFTELLPSGPKKSHARAVVNTNDPRGKFLASTLKIPCCTTGYSEENMIRAERFRFSPEGIEADIATPDGMLRIRSALTGAHNVENILCAVGAAVALQVPTEAIVAGIASRRTVAGRLETVPDGKGRHVFVDYAHTPDALENVLKALKTMARRRMICVFGCGGDRDRKKRPMMGEIVGRMADLAVVTSDNPRSEDPEAIIADILPGVVAAAPKRYDADTIESDGEPGYLVEPDRRKAIRLAIRAADAGDMVLIAGKGHETYQILKDRTIDFDDRVEARRALAGEG